MTKQEFINRHSNLGTLSIEGSLHNIQMEKDLNALIREAQARAFSAGNMAGYFNDHPKLCEKTHGYYYFEDWHKQQEK